MSIRGPAPPYMDRIIRTVPAEAAAAVVGETCKVEVAAVVGGRECFWETCPPPFKLFPCPFRDTVSR